MALAIGLRVLLHTVTEPHKAQRVGARGWTAAVLLVLLGLALEALLAFQATSEPDAAVQAGEQGEQPPPSALELAWGGVAPPLLGFLIATINGTLGMRFGHAAALLGLMQCAASLWLWKGTDVLATRIALGSTVAALALGWSVSHLHERMHRSSFLLRHDLRLRDDAATAALHEIEAEMEQEIERIVVLRRAAGADEVIRRLREELRRSREELSRAALRVRESTARREAAERSTRAHTRFWLSTQSQRQGQKQTQSQSQSQRQSPVHGLRDSQRRAEPQDALG